MTRVYVGNLPLDIRTRDIEDLFWKYGRIRDIDLKTPSRPPAFAFVSFEKFEDAEDAIRGRDGVQFEGSRLRCELSRGSADQVYGGGGGGGGGSRYDDRGGGGRYGDRGGRGGGGDPRGGRPPPRDLRRSDFRVIVSNLPSSASWQDLKDHFRQAGDVIYTDVDRKGGGIVEFATKADQEAAINKLDDTEFKNPFDKVYIRVKYPREQGGGGKDSRSRSRSRSRDRRDRSPRRSSSRSRSRSRSGGRRGRGGDDDKDDKDDKRDDDEREEKMDDKDRDEKDDKEGQKNPSEGKDEAEEKKEGDE